jgi:solute carrier family 25 phosphate transporter 3
MQTSDRGTFPTSFSKGFSSIKANEGLNGFYKGISPLWMRQVPYTMVKFAAFENIVKAFYKNIFTQPKENYSKSFQLMITFLSGYIAGIFCAIVSHPADTMVSILNKRSSDAPVV